MNTRPAFAFLTVLLAAAVAPPALAQYDTTSSAPAATTTTTTYAQPQLDQMLAPIALYPDPLLAQVLTAATYPLEVVQAARWSRANPDLKGSDAVAAAADQGWDPNVKALLAFPDLLQMMDDKIEWTQHLGEAFLAQPAQVMDSVQGLRRSAEAAGNLSSGGELSVADNDGIIDVEPAAQDLVYLPYYDPTLVYGAWPWLGFPPVYWPPWPGFGWQGAFAWGSGTFIGVNFFCDDFDWHHHRIDVFAHGRPPRGRDGFVTGGGEPARVWQHEPAHRRGVAYGNPDLMRTFGRTPIANAPGTLRNRVPATFAPRAMPSRAQAYARSYAAPMIQREIAVPRAAPLPRAYSGGERVAPVRAFAAPAHAFSARAPMSVSHAPEHSASSTPHGR